MTTKTIIFTFLIIPILSFSQDKKSSSDRKERKDYAKTQIIELHDGALLIRLKSRKKSRRGPVIKQETSIKEKMELLYEKSPR